MTEEKQALAVDHEERQRITAQVVRYYDSEAAIYDQSRYLTERGRKADAFHRRMLDQLFEGELSPGDKVIEIGCGTGRLLPHMAKKGITLTGIDISTGMLVKAQQRLAKAGLSSVNIVEGDITALSFPLQSVRAAYSIMVVNLIPDYVRAFDAIRRLLEPGGVFVFNVPYLGGLWGAGGLYVNMRKRSRTSNASGFRYSRWFTRHDVACALASSGFVVEDVRGMPFYVDRVENAQPLRDRKASLFFAKSLFVKARRE